MGLLMEWIQVVKARDGMENWKPKTSELVG